MIKPPERFLRSKERRELWENCRDIVRKAEKAIPISEAYLSGSFTSDKRRPADLDFVILLKTRKTKPDSRWSVDFIIASDNRHGKLVLKDVDKWIAKKYGRRKSGLVRLK
jgi:hypothetical protein